MAARVDWLRLVIGRHVPSWMQHLRGRHCTVQTQSVRRPNIKSEQQLLLGSSSFRLVLLVVATICIKWKEIYIVVNKLIKWFCVFVIVILKLYSFIKNQLRLSFIFEFRKRASNVFVYKYLVAGVTCWGTFANRHRNKC